MEWAHKACLLVLAVAMLLVGGATRSVAAPAPARSDNDDLPGDSSAVGAPAGGEAAPAAAASAPPASDAEAPVRPRRTVPRLHVLPPAEAETPKWLRHPGSGLTFDLGAFGGGTDLASAEYTDGSMDTLSGGTGLLASVGAIWTPFWAGDAVGFGVGGYLGVKYYSVGGNNSSVSLNRFPIGGGAHVLIRIGERWFLFLRGGIQKEFGISLSADGYGSASLDGSLGGLGEGGFYYVTSMSDDHLAMLFTFRYTSGRDSANGASFSADSAGVIWAIHYNL